MHHVLDQLLGASAQEEARLQFNDLRKRLEGKTPSTSETLKDGFYDATAVLALSEKYRKQLRTTNMLERFIQEIRRREKVIRIFPNMSSAYRLASALCAETHEEWSIGRRYLNMDEYFQWRADRSQEETFSEEASPGGELDPQPTAVPD